MQIHTITGVGRSHPLHTEDHIFYHQINTRWLVGAVMDGCSSAKESYFPSTLYAKSFASTLGQINRAELSDSEYSQKLGLLLLQNLRADLKAVQHLLHLDLVEILATVSLFVLDTETSQATVWVAGDGYIVCNGHVDEIDHKNTPDYPAYHLEKTFIEWIENHVAVYHYKKVKELTISTDGIGKIRKNPSLPGIETDPLWYLLLEPPGNNYKNSLQQKYDDLMGKEGYIPYDDLGVIRVIL